MNMERPRGMTKQQLFNYIVDNNVGDVAKNLIMYRTGVGFKLSVDQSRNPKRQDITVSKFEFSAPMNIRDEVFESFNIYGVTFTCEVAILIHRFFMAQPGGQLIFYDEEHLT